MNKIKPNKHIHRIIKKHAPKSIHKTKKLFGFKYPKLFFFILFIFLSYKLFNLPFVEEMISSLGGLNYLGAFIAGLLITFGFSAPFGIGFFLTMQVESMILTILVGGVGAVVGDLLIFNTIKFSLMDEFNELGKTHLVREIKEVVKHNPSILIRHYLLYIFAGILITVPGLPDEIGVPILAGFTTIKKSSLAIIGFVLHSLAIFLMLFINVAI